jgi:TetR/AcrR family transcriptional repressor of nem operon
VPRVSRAETEQNRIAIEEVASRLFREKGFGVSVADLMAAAGLTHGGFYGHFESKDALMDTACRHAFEGSVERWQRRAAGKQGRAERLPALIDGYLAPHNRNAPGSGCPMAGLASDVAREAASHPVRKTYAAGLRQLLDILVAAQDSTDVRQSRSDALAQLCTLVGAMVLARATRGDRLSDELLGAARARLLGEV